MGTTSVPRDLLLVGRVRQSQERKYVRFFKTVVVIMKKTIYGKD